MLKSVVKIIIGAALIFLFVLRAQAATILQYHHVSNSTPAATSISPSLFAEHMRYLRDNNFEVLALPDVVAHLRAGKELPSKAVVITFDDAYRSVYDEAFPLLKRYGWPFTVFVNAKPIDEGRKQFMNWQELKEMAVAGATIANHSYSHAHLIRREAGESAPQWRKRIEEDLAKNQSQLERHIGQKHKLLAYPYGEYDRALQRLVEAEGYVALAQHSGPIGSESDLSTLPRFPFGGDYGALEEFKVKAASLPMPRKSALVLSGNGKKPLEDIVLPKGEARPMLQLDLGQPALARRVQCFATGQGAIEVKIEGSRVIAQAKKDLPVGRSHYNCTASSDEAGRFYWYSAFFIRKQSDGEWYPER